MGTAPANVLHTLHSGNRGLEVDVCLCCRLEIAMKPIGKARLRRPEALIGNIPATLFEVLTDTDSPLRLRIPI